MTPFLATMTNLGRDLVMSVRDARTAADIGALMEKYKDAALPALLEERSILSDADEFAFGCALATYLPGTDRVRATNWEAAALTALRARAHAEALVALEKGRGVRPLQRATRTDRSHPKASCGPRRHRPGSVERSDGEGARETSEAVLGET